MECLGGGRCARSEGSRVGDCTNDGRVGVAVSLTRNRVQVSIYHQLPSAQACFFLSLSITAVMTVVMRLVRTCERAQNDRLSSAARPGVSTMNNRLRRDYRLISIANTAVLTPRLPIVLLCIR